MLFAERSAANVGDAAIGDWATLGLDPTRGPFDSQWS
jgi:hypothetical protein